MPKLFGTLKTRYADRPGGYTRVLRTEPKKSDQAPSAVLELVDGPQDMRFAMTAAAVARDRVLGRSHSDLTERNRAKVTRFRTDGDAAFEAMVKRTRRLNLAEPGLQMADIEPVIVRRHPRATLDLRKAKPVHDFWEGTSGSGSRRSGGYSKRGSGSTKSLAEAVGEPSLMESTRPGSTP